MRRVLIVISALALLAPAFVHAEGDEPARIVVGDTVTVTISDLEAVGVETTRTQIVDHKGAIELPLIGKTKAADLTEAEAEKAIAEAYAHAKIIDRAQVSVKVGQPTTKPGK